MLLDFLTPKRTHPWVRAYFLGYANAAERAGAWLEEVGALTKDAGQMMRSTYEAFFRFEDEEE